ncbi:hypothetical protein ACFPRL_11780 [Pseudoclavibacter helvolus]
MPGPIWAHPIAVHSASSVTRIHHVSGCVARDASSFRRIDAR